MPGVWDYQCMYDGRLRPYLECSSHSTYFREQYMCVQYPDLCNPNLVAEFSVPLQKAYLSDFATTRTRPGNGGFFFSCYLGSYWEMLFVSNLRLRPLLLPLVCLFVVAWRAAEPLHALICHHRTGRYPSGPPHRVTAKARSGCRLEPDLGR